MHKVVILGGGFAGVRCALDLAKQDLADTSITLISDREHFEYHAALYRVVAGRNQAEVCIPLSVIFAKTGIDLAVDAVTSIDVVAKQVHGHSASVYNYDNLVITLGSETAYFNIPGLKQFAFGFKSLAEASDLKAHLHSLFAATAGQALGPSGHIEVIGAGPSGVELAGELAVYLQKLARKHKVKASQIKIDLIEAAPRILPLLPEDLATRVHQRLSELGVRVLTGKTVIKEEVEQLYLKDSQIQSRTVIWTAGVKPHQLLSTTLGLPLDQRGRLLVNDSMQLLKQPEIYAAGDVAVTKFGGMAQTAVDQARVVAANIGHSYRGEDLISYKPKPPVCAIPVGPGWAAVADGPRRMYGSVGWSKRRRLDWLFFRSILPLTKAITAYRSGAKFAETCAVCRAAD